MRHFLILILCVALFVSPFGTAIGAEALPSGLLDAELEAAIDAFVDDHLDTTAAVSVAVARGQETLLSKAYGYANIEAGLQAGADTVYEWGSVTKLLVWVSVMQLVEGGELDLETDVRDYLPYDFFTKLTCGKPITMLHLMHHNAGWEDVLIDLFVDPGSDINNLEQTLRDTEPNQIFSPGIVCAYSNWGVALAALIVERISGETFYEYVQNHIFAPLSMEHTALSPSLADNEWVQNNRPLTQGYVGLVPLPVRYAIPLYPAGMATGTLHDFLLFLKALLPEEGETSPLFREADTLSLLFTPSFLYADGSPRNYHGFWALDFGTPVIGHGGNTASFSAHLLIEPTEKIGMVVLTNQANETVYNSVLPELIFGAYSLEPSTETMPDAGELQGLYRSARIVYNGCTKLYGAISLLPLLDGDENTLRASLLGQTAELRQLKPDVFATIDPSTETSATILRAERSEDGSTKLSAPYFDYLQIPVSEGILDAAMLLLLALAFVYCAFTLVCGGIRRLILRIRKRRGQTSPMRKAHLWMCALGVFEVINMGWMAINLMSFAPKQTIKFHIAFTWVFAAAAAAYLVLLLIKIWKLDCNRREKALYILTGVCTLGLLANIVMWQLYRL